MWESKITINVIIKAIVMVLLIPIFIYVLFYYLERDFMRPWFWAIILGIGNLMLLLSSPNQEITQGIRKLHLFDWLFITAISLIPFFLPGDNIVTRIIKSLCLFASFVGYAVFHARKRKGVRS